jgi:Uncharacterised protein family (UPF0220)
MCLQPGGGFLVLYVRVCGVMCRMNVVNLKDAIDDDDDWEESGGRTARVRVWLFITFTILFCCVAGGIWIMAAHFPDNWTGVAILLQPILLMFRLVLESHENRTHSRAAQRGKCTGERR